MHEIEFNEIKAQLLIESQFPELNVTNITYLGEGWDNYAYLINNEWVFRFPHRAVAVPLIEREIQVLSNIADSLPIAVPKPRYLGEPSEHYQWPFYGYRQVIGSTGCQIDFTENQYQQAAIDLGNFFKCLHSLDAKSLNQFELDQMIFNRLDLDLLLGIVQQRKAEVTCQYSLDTYEAMIAHTIAQAREVTIDGNLKVIIHGDCYSRHCVFDNDHRLAGIIDWGDTGISHPVVDLAVVYQFLPFNTHSNFYSYYGDISDEIKIYARFLGLYYALALIWYGFKNQDVRLIECCQMTLDNHNQAYLSSR